jgi:hypothetical protein
MLYKKGKDTVGWVIRSAVIDNFMIDTETIQKILGKNGFTDVKPSTISSFMNSTRETLRVLKHKGLYSNY